MQIVLPKSKCDLIAALEEWVDQLEQYSRLENLIITGVNFASATVTDGTAVDAPTVAAGAEMFTLPMA